MKNKIKKGKIYVLVFDQKRNSRRVKFYYLEKNDLINCTAETLQMAKILLPEQDRIDGLPVNDMGYLATGNSPDSAGDILRLAGDLKYLDVVRYKLL